MIKTLVVFLHFFSTTPAFIIILDFWFDNCPNHFTHKDDISSVRFSTAMVLKFLVEEYKGEILNDNTYTKLIAKIKHHDILAYSQIAAVIRDR
eukprot:UN15376